MFANSIKSIVPGYILHDAHGGFDRALLFHYEGVRKAEGTIEVFRERTK